MDEKGEKKRKEKRKGRKTGEERKRGKSAEGGTTNTTGVGKRGDKSLRATHGTIRKEKEFSTKRSVQKQSQEEGEEKLLARLRMS
jgi:hypothetical protein